MEGMECFFFNEEFNLGRNKWGYKKHIIEPHTSTMINGREWNGREKKERERRKRRNT
jgi:hypothetical protein